MLPRKTRSVLLITGLAVATFGSLQARAPADDEEGKTTDQHRTEVEPPPEKAVKSIKGTEAKKHLYFLASTARDGSTLQEPMPPPRSLRTKWRVDSFWML